MTSQKSGICKKTSHCQSPSATVLGNDLHKSRLHVAIARRGKNRYYVDLFTRLLDEVPRILRLYYSSFNDVLPRQYVSEHGGHDQAIINRDAETADRLATAHADQIVRQIRSYIASDGVRARI